MKTRARLLLWSPVAVLLLFETYLSGQSRLPSPGFSFSGMDKLAHAGYFFLVGLFGVRAARFGERWSAAKVALFFLPLAFLYGCLDEFHQSFVPGRDVEIGDVLADTLGVFLAVVGGAALLEKLRLDRVRR